MLNQITPILLTFNEEANIERTLTALSWAEDVLVVDSFSTDSTLDICASFSNVRVVKNGFISFAQQCNFALQQNIQTEWVLSMDADYVVTPELILELSGLEAPSTINGYKINFEYLINGKPLRGSLYPARTALYRKSCAEYEQDGHAHRVKVTAEIGQLEAKLQHDDRKPYSRWLRSQQKYAQQEAVKLSNTAWRELSWPDRFRVIGLAPFLVIPYTLIVKGLALSGWPGLQYTWQRLVAEIYLQRARFR